MFNTVHFSLTLPTNKNISSNKKLEIAINDMKQSEMFITTKPMTQKGVHYFTITVGAGSNNNYDNQLVACNSMIDLDTKTELDPFNQDDIDFFNAYVEGKGYVEDEFINLFLKEKKSVYVYLLRPLDKVYTSTVKVMFENSDDGKSAPSKGNSAVYKNVSFDKAFAGF